MTGQIFRIDEHGLGGSKGGTFIGFRDFLREVDISNKGIESGWGEGGSRKGGGHRNRYSK